MEHQSFAPYVSRSAEAPPTTEQSRLEQSRLDEKKRLKRAANRRSACTSRVRKKQFVEEMTAANERLAVYGAILARAPPTITVDEACAVRFASRSARELLGLDLSEALDGLNLVDLLAADDHQPAAARWVRAAAAGAKAEAPRWDPGAPPAADWRPLEWSASQGSVNVVSSDNSGGSDEARSGSDDGRNSSEDSDERPAVEDSADKRDKSPPPALPDLIGAAGAGGGFPRKRCYADVVDRQPVAAPPPPSFRADDGYREPSPHGSAASSGDDEAAPAGDGHRLCLVCRSGRVVVVDAVRGGSFASAAPVANVVGGGFGGDDDDAESEATTQPPSPYHGAPQPPSSFGSRGPGAPFAPPRQFARAPSTESAATAADRAPSPGRRETVLALRVVDGRGGANEGRLAVAAPPQSADDGAAPPRPSPRAGARRAELRPLDVVDALAGGGACVEGDVERALLAARDAPRPPRSPPKLEELCGSAATRDDLQNVVEGLMLIAGVAPDH